jgi:hypothetical protein
MKKTATKSKTATGGDRFLIRNDGDFRHYGNTDHEGHLIFWETGTVTVQWNRAAAIASSHGAGHRGVRATIATGKRTPPKLDPLFELIDECRFLADFREATGDPLPTNPADDRVPKLLETSFRDIAWKMVSAVLQGNANSLHEIAGKAALVKDVRTIAARKWEDLAEAIRIAAVKAGCPPFRHDVEDAFRKLVGSNRANKDSIREDLGRMGFDWLPRLSGRPPKVG